MKPKESADNPTTSILFLVVGIAILAVSASAIFVRLAQAPPLAVAFWRNALALIVFVPWALKSKKKLTAREVRFSILAGLFLAAHFALWITSLSHTSVSASVFLVCTQPLFVTVLAFIFLKEKPTWVIAIGMACALLGTALIALLSGAAQGALSGNLLALGGAVTVAFYVLVGRVVRTKDTPLISYVAVVYATAALALFALAFAAGVPLSLTPAQAFWVGLIALFPQVVGHTLFNWALRYLPAAVLSSMILAEPVMSTLLAFWVLNEAPEQATLWGSILILGGLALVIWGTRRRSRSSAIQ